MKNFGAKTIVLCFYFYWVMLHLLVKTLLWKFWPEIAAGYILSNFGSLVSSQNFRRNSFYRQRFIYIHTSQVICNLIKLLHAKWDKISSENIFTYVENMLIESTFRMAIWSTAKWPNLILHSNKLMLGKDSRSVLRRKYFCISLLHF